MEHRINQLIEPVQKWISENRNTHQKEESFTKLEQLINDLKHLFVREESIPSSINSNSSVIVNDLYEGDSTKLFDPSYIISPRHKRSKKSEKLNNSSGGNLNKKKDARHFSDSKLQSDTFLSKSNDSLQKTGSNLSNNCFEGDKSLNAATDVIFSNDRLKLMTANDSEEVDGTILNKDGENDNNEKNDTEKNESVKKNIEKNVNEMDVNEKIECETQIKSGEVPKNDIDRVGFLKKKAAISACLKEFGKSPKKAINNLIKKELIENDPKAVATFLLSEKWLNKTRLGEYLGEGDNFNMEVLKYFINNIQFADMDVVEGLRLPGEAQKIDRVMNNFAIRYCEQNPQVFQSSDTAYILSYSLIMLNTDAHNPNVKSKMTLKDFIKNNRGIDDNRDLNEEYLTNLYNNIVNNEITMDPLDDEQIKLAQLNRQLVGKPEDLDLVIPNRHLIDKFPCQFLDAKSDSHKHERTIFLFNDILIIAKPIKSGRKFQHKFIFNIIDCQISLVKEDPKKTIFSLKVKDDQTLTFELKPENITLIPIFNDLKEQAAFESSIEQDEKNDQITLTKAAAVKAALELTYSESDTRYKKFGSLRQARAALIQRNIPEAFTNSKTITRSETSKSLVKEQLTEEEVPSFSRPRSNTFHGYAITSVTAALEKSKPELFSVPEKNLS